MDKQAYKRLLETYRGEVSPDIIKQYKDADEWVVLNEDKMLHPIWIKLPKPPPHREIEGFGLPAKDQKFRYEEMPERLEKLVNSCEKIDEIWQELETHQLRYKEEIEWIRTQIKKVLKGHWVFINGKPTYLDGWHYGYLNFWRFQTKGRPEYRDRNRKFFHGMRYAYTTTETIVYDSEGKIVYEDPILKRPKMKDVGRKLFLGIIYPKHRRDGASNECLCAMFFETIFRFGKNNAIISMSGQHAETSLFREISVAGWKQMPFFFKPITKSNENPNDAIEFFASRKRADSAKNSKELGSKIFFSSTADSTQLDGKKIFWLLADEGGKAKDVDVYQRHQQLRECVAQGAGTVIEGFMPMPSTVGEMEGAGGRKYFELCEHSKWNERLPTGQTQTGLMLIYIPAYEGLEGYVDEYGNSIVENPTPDQKEFTKNDFGAKEYLTSRKEELLRKGNMEKYAELCRLFPESYIECFRTKDGEIGFNLKNINDRIDLLSYEKKHLYVRGNFVWDCKKKDTFVHFMTDPDGKFLLSEILNPDQTNRMYKRVLAGNVIQRFPHEPKYIGCADPFKFENARSVGSKLSDGGGAIFKEYDHAIDADNTKENWLTHRFVCTYLHRPAIKDEYLEDMLMMCVYYGARMFPEADSGEDIQKYFENRGYAGYLKFEIDHNTNIPRKQAGFLSRTRKTELFDKLRDYIEEHAHRECHIDFLKQCKEIQSTTQMTDYDLLTACGGCLLGTDAYINHFVKEQTKPQKTGKPIYPKRRY
jgi:hypothetical protein